MSNNYTTKKSVLEGEIVELYATISKHSSLPYFNVYDNLEEAKKEIGKKIDGFTITDVIKGYSLKPKNSNFLFDEAPDFCKSINEIKEFAKDLNINLE